MGAEVQSVSEEVESEQALSAREEVISFLGQTKELVETLEELDTVKPGNLSLLIAQAKELQALVEKMYSTATDICDSIRCRFEATGQIVAEGRTIEVMKLDGALYTREEWDSDGPLKCDWELDEGEVLFQGNSIEARYIPTPTSLS